MAKETKVREASILDDITIAPPVVAPPDRYANAPVERYANAPVAERYAAADRYQQAGVDAPDRAAPNKRYRGTDRSGSRGRYQSILTRPAPKLTRRIILVPPTLRTEGQLMWLPTKRYEEVLSQEEIDCPMLWALHEIVYFDFAEEVTRIQYMNERLWCGDDEQAIEEAATALDFRIYAVAIDSESRTFRGTDWEYESEEGPETMDQALELRAELDDDPHEIVSNLEYDDLSALQLWTGLGRLPMHTEVIEAIEKDSLHGLGGAALDYATWRVPERFGRTGVMLANSLERMEEEDFLMRSPVEAFLLRSGSLHPRCGRDADDDYRLGGDYSIEKITYTSDTSGKAICGWRSLWLEVLPD